uniref:Uncharacterized protein n=1 Tax=Palpitomonas bilix TaxID=652834 RepID=A0A7S3LXC2_9EUKA|mmetsp:Transcript_7560/g.19578  ORF Transcript_7560/g.19578 Transcript_7560/m.19578 type:complete len:182 (+) Transcript_7560:131-676(+)
MAWADGDIDEAVTTILRKVMSEKLALELEGATTIRDVAKAASEGVGRAQLLFQKLFKAIEYLYFRGDVHISRAVMEALEYVALAEDPISIVGDAKKLRMLNMDMIELAKSHDDAVVRKRAGVANETLKRKLPMAVESFKRVPAVLPDDFKRWAWAKTSMPEEERRRREQQAAAERRARMNH